MTPEFIQIIKIACNIALIPFEISEVQKESKKPPFFKINKEKYFSPMAVLRFIANICETDFLYGKSDMERL